MKSAAIIRSYALTDYLKPCIKQFDWLDKVLVMNFRFNKADETEDNTMEIVKELNQPNVQCLYGSGIEQHEAYMIGLDILRKYDSIFIFDADEFMLRKDQEKILENFNQQVAAVSIVDYIDDFNHALPLRSHKPPILTRPDTNFYNVRNYWGSRNLYEDVYMHHLGYLLSPQHMEWKKKWEDKEEGLGKLDEFMSGERREVILPQEIRELL